MRILKFHTESTSVTMKSDTGQRVDGDYGVQYKWECNSDDCFYATENFNQLLKQSNVKAGDMVNIKKIPKEDIQGKSFMVFSVNDKTLDDFANSGTPYIPEPEKMATPNSDFADKLIAIEKRLATLEASVNPVSKEDIPF